MLHDQELQRYWLQQLKLLGEIKAAELLMEEAIRF